MTEITASTSLLYPSRVTRQHLVDPVAFALAMVGGPVITGILGAPLVLLPTFAAVLGGPFYLLIGVPVMLAWMRRRRASPGRWAFLALCSHICVFATLAGIAQLNPQYEAEWPTIYLLFGVVFAPIWGAVSGRIYSAMERDFYKQTL